MATTEPLNPFVTRPVLGINIAVSNYDEAIEQSLVWAREGQSRALFFAAVHMIMETVDDPAFLRKLDIAGTVFPDGMPLVWALHALGERRATRVYGPDFMSLMLAAAERAGVPVGFYGASQATLDALVAAVRLRHPNLDVAYIESPPFRPLTAEEDSAAVERIASSHARLLFVGLGCPKQERWIVEHLGRVPAVMFAVGAAFDFFAGNKRQAPRWMQRNGLEWVFRFVTEPRRLAMRYLKQNPRFVLRFLRQLLG
jgi:N-acetylglucosaminyldiphosphoundecaprenol N-acetyl-beta-D-mannosaminyltransferase